MIEVVALASLFLAAASGGTEKASGRWTKVYRGTQRSDRRTVRGLPSFTPSLDVALVWSAVPGSWSHSASFLPTSSVEEALVRVDRVLLIGEGRTWTSVGEVCRPLQMAEDEVVKVFNYLHNRLTGRAAGGDFQYRVDDEEGEQISPDEVPFSLTHPETLVSLARDLLYGDPSVVDRVFVDAFVLADAPAVQRAVRGAGYDAIVYRDVFDGARQASRDLLGRDVLDLPGVEEDEDLSGEIVPSHLTVRPVDASVVKMLGTNLSQELLSQRKLLPSKEPR